MWLGVSLLRNGVSLVRNRCFPLAHPRGWWCTPSQPLGSCASPISCGMGGASSAGKRTHVEGALQRLQLPWQQPYALIREAGRERSQFLEAGRDLSASSPILQCCDCARSEAFLKSFNITAGKCDWHIPICKQIQSSPSSPTASASWGAGVTAWGWAVLEMQMGSPCAPALDTVLPFSWSLGYH